VLIVGLWCALSVSAEAVADEQCANGCPQPETVTPDIVEKLSCGCNPCPCSKPPAVNTTNSTANSTVEKVWYVGGIQNTSGAVTYTAPTTYNATAQVERIVQQIQPTLTSQVQALMGTPTTAASLTKLEGDAQAATASLENTKVTLDRDHAAKIAAIDEQINAHKAETDKAAAGYKDQLKAVTDQIKAIEATIKQYQKDARVRAKRIAREARKAAREKARLERRKQKEIRRMQKQKAWEIRQAKADRKRRALEAKERRKQAKLERAQERKEEEAEKEAERQAAHQHKLQLKFVQAADELARKQAIAAAEAAAAAKSLAKSHGSRAADVKAAQAAALEAGKRAAALAKADAIAKRKQRDARNKVLASIARMTKALARKRKFAARQRKRELFRMRQQLLKLRDAQNQARQALRVQAEALRAHDAKVAREQAALRSYKRDQERQARDAARRAAREAKEASIAARRARKEKLALLRQRKALLAKARAGHLSAMEKAKFVKVNQDLQAAALRQREMADRRKIAKDQERQENEYRTRIANLNSLNKARQEIAKEKIQRKKLHDSEVRGMRKDLDKFEEREYKNYRKKNGILTRKQKAKKRRELANKAAKKRESDKKYEVRVKADQKHRRRMLKVQVEEQRRQLMGLCTEMVSYVSRLHAQHAQDYFTYKALATGKRDEIVNLLVQINRARTELNQPPLRQPCSTEIPEPRFVRMMKTLSNIDSELNKEIKKLRQEFADIAEPMENDKYRALGEAFLRRADKIRDLNDRRNKLRKQLGLKNVPIAIALTLPKWEPIDHKGTQMAEKSFKTVVTWNEWARSRAARARKFFVEHRKAREKKVQELREHIARRNRDLKKNKTPEAELEEAKIEELQRSAELEDAEDNYYKDVAQERELEQQESARLVDDAKRIGNFK